MYVMSFWLDDWTSVRDKDTVILLGTTSRQVLCTTFPPVERVRGIHKLRINEMTVHPRRVVLDFAFLLTELKQRQITGPVLQTLWAQ